MGLYSNLPALVPAVVVFILISIAAALALAWVRSPDARKIVVRVWIAASVFLVAGVAIFWISTAMVEGPRRGTVDRDLQGRQQQELEQRLKDGGH